ncbi:hypothetical protein GC207_12440 [bacterium]|nr:hypothetical protein [bacterium]
MDLSRLKVFPLADRRSLTRADDILVAPESEPGPVSESAMATIAEAKIAIAKARERNATVLLIYGAHLLRNGAALIINDLLDRGLITHLATNGAGTIHDWEYAWLGRSTESVRDNVATGTFGTWDETGRNIQLSLLAGALRGEGYGRALGRFIEEDGCELPGLEELRLALQQNPDDPLSPARAELLQTMIRFGLKSGRHAVNHQWKHASIIASAFRHGVPMTVHPGIGYDIISNHPMFNGAAIGRAAEMDFRLFGGSVEHLDDGVVLSVGSAIMGPQVFEKSSSCVNNLRLQAGRSIVRGHSIFVVDLQDGGGWDWRQGEPPKTNPAYYLRFCKSFARMGGTMHYAQCDNVTFLHHLHHHLLTP